MQPTLIGIIVFVIGALVALIGTTPAMLGLMMLTALMQGSAAIALPALGGSSIPPLQLALGLLVVRVLLPAPGHLQRLNAAVRANLALIVFVGYGVAGAVVLPRIFAGAMQVPPLRFAGLTYIYDTVRLGPSSQNVTTTVYLLGTMMVAICAHIAVSSERGPLVFVRTALIVCWAHIALGILSVVGKGTPIDSLLGFFRNGAYAQLDQSYNGIIRMNGIAPEPSSYAGFAFAWFVLVLELWLRRIWPRRTGATAAAMALILLMSTSGTAYVGLGGYGVVVALRMLMPGSAANRHLLPIAAAGVVAMTLVAVACIAVPELITSFSTMFLHMTVDKGDSQSGLQRAFWAKKGIEAFVVSHGLGIGPGSFRSSSLATAILGSMGVIGAMTFIVYLVQVLKPLRASTYGEVDDARIAVGAAASWAALGVLIPSFIAAPSADPGTNFAIFSGVALALRLRPVSAPHFRPIMTRSARPA